MSIDRDRRAPRRYDEEIVKCGERCLDNEELLGVAGVALVHAVPRGVCERAADGPHHGYGGFSSVGSLSLGSHLKDARGAAGGAGGVEAHGAGGGRDAGEEACEHDCDCVCVWVEI